ncbi:MAG TPA: START-like domain-containing protein [Cyclobacteriaceae bacterium]|jgi:uncharacterized protein YndB with AHSA1/START domain
MAPKKRKCVCEFEINASTKMLYPYLYTAGGLAQWFCDDVTVDEDKNFNFIWDGNDHKAKLVSHRVNNFVRFEFIPDENENDPSYFELRLEMNELTESVFLKIIDYSDFEDEDELRDLWEGLIGDLKEIVGG